ncbi:MAG: hypothetical protein E6K93_01785 [Thaumarchaeota archaeon]|nr:MAG: hypothetical protein E6K93_01785 [Nitrososphaerota archaeon]
MTNTISEVSLEKAPEKFKEGENVTVNVKFSITGALRQAFNEKNWEKAYNKHDNVFKLRYGIKLYSGGLRKREIGKALDTYKKVALFWTRNPKLTQMGEKKVWVQISKNFEPFIPKNQVEAQEVLLDFDEKMHFNASELGVGKHKIGAEIYVSWFKHDYAEPFDQKAHSKEIEIEITK